MRLAYYGSGGLLDGLMQGLLVRIKSAIYIYILRANLTAIDYNSVLLVSKRERGILANPSSLAFFAFLQSNINDPEQNGVAYCIVVMR